MVVLLKERCDLWYGRKHFYGDVKPIFDFLAHMVLVYINKYVFPLVTVRCFM